tara:strand:- start:582 stop:950 length:369 start_codon:yes stop_codon:yes gene_type:complete
VEKLKKIFLDPNGWVYFHTIDLGGFFYKTLHQNSQQSTILVHHIPAGITNNTNRPVFIYMGMDKESSPSFIEKSIGSIPFSMSLDLGEIDIDVMGKEYIDFLMELHKRRRAEFVKRFEDVDV